MHPYWPAGQPQPDAQTAVDEEYDLRAPLEDEDVIAWHFEQLQRPEHGGWTKGDAAAMARTPCDLHRLASLLAGGCPRELAWKLAT